MANSAAKQNLKWLALFLLVELASVVWLGKQPQAEPLWRLMHLLQMLLVMDWLVYSAQGLQQRQGLWLLLALLFSFGGDLINSGLLPLTFWQPPRALLSILFSPSPSSFISAFLFASTADKLGQPKPCYG